ncbi:MAG: hypothetical protein ACJ73D_07535 [Pyrinomonadaceae bacterium]
MKEPVKNRYLPAVIFVLVLAALTSPIWCVPFFLGQDSSAHLYTAYVMLRLLDGDPQFSSVFMIQPVVVPNSSGHWIMALLVGLFTPETVTRVMLTGTLALFAASVLWLKRRVTGSNGGVLTVLFAFAIGLNWLWLNGTYNHVLGAMVFLFAVGLFYRWRDDMGVARTAILAVVLVIAYVSHLFAFLLLAGALPLLAFFSVTRVRSLVAATIAILPSIPMLVGFRRVSSAEGVPPIPSWESVVDPYSVTDWLRQFVWADPFILISRRTLPFLHVQSPWFLVLSPIVLISVAAGLLILRRGIGAHLKRLRTDRRLPLAIMCGGALIFAIIGPDDFGLQNGSLIRERLMIIGMSLAVVFFRPTRPYFTNLAAGGVLSLLMVLQTMALWDYGLRTSKEVAPFAAAAGAIPHGKTMASVILAQETLRFRSLPLAQVSSYEGVKTGSIVWDNYEWRHYMFPVVTRDARLRPFVFELTTANVFYLDDPADNFEEKLSRLEKVLESNNDQIDILLVYGSDDRMDRVVNRWYSDVPIFTDGELRVLMHKAPADH